MLCKERLSLIIRRANNSAVKLDELFNFIATNRLFIVVYPLVVYSLVVLISVGLVYYCRDFSPYEHYSCHIGCDAPKAWGLYFQDSASPQMEALVQLHDSVMHYLVAILITVGWIQSAILRKSTKS